MKIKTGSILYYFFVFLNLTAGVSISAWLYSMSGTKGLLAWDPFYRNVFIALVCTAFAGVAFLILEKSLFARLFPRKKRFFSAVTVVVSVIFTLPSVALVFYTQNGLTPPDQNISPILVLSGGNGHSALNSVSVVEWTEKETMGRITIDDGENVKELSDTAAAFKHVYGLGELEPGKKYEIAFENGKKSRISVPQFSNRFAFTSDAHFGRSESRIEYTADIFEEVCKPENTFTAFFFLGDMVETGFTGSDWIEALGYFKMRENSIPTFFLAGNHDLLFGGEYDYERYLTVSKNTGTDEGRIGRLDFGKIHFLYLPLYWGTEEFTQGDMDWLISQLQSIPSDDFTVVLSHCMFYSSGVMLHGKSWADHFETTEKFSPVFEKYGVDLVVSGHNHHMEHLEKGGVNYAVIGTAGGLPDPERTIVSPYSIWYADKLFGYLDLTVNDYDFIISFKNTEGKTIYEKTVPIRR